MWTAGRSGLRLLVAAVAVAVALAAPGAADAHRLSGSKARAKAQTVVRYVAAVLSVTYRGDRSGIDRCSNQGDHQVTCAAYWDVTEKRGGKRWHCTAEIRVWYESDRSDFLRWDYRRLRCARTRR